MDQSVKTVLWLEDHLATFNDLGASRGLFPDQGVSRDEEQRVVVRLRKLNMLVEFGEYRLQMKSSLFYMHAF